MYESRGGRPGLSVPVIPYVLGSPFLVFLMLSADVKQH